ncbi:MAG: hypothetical protein KKB74_11200 [Bacteroidetes bacterium]|nr:hypothetical protein [Bacteroidota bacterium]
MKVIASATIPQRAINQLKAQFDVVLFETEGITYPAISNHPDVFMCQSRDGFLVASNFPEKAKKMFADYCIPIQYGNLSVGPTYPESARYNAVVTEKYFIHHLKHTDPELLRIYRDKKLIHVNQAYTRCNLLALRDNWFVTSDRGIEKALMDQGLNVLYVDPISIRLPGFDHGFFGGTCGILDDTVYFIGDLAYHPQGGEIRLLFEKLGYNISSLYDGPLFDGGSLYFYP